MSTNAQQRRTRLPEAAAVAMPESSDPEDLTLWEHVRPREIDEATWRRFEDHMRDIFSALGMDLDTPGTRDTARRFLVAMFDSTAGYEGDPKLVTAFPTECRGGADCRLSQIIEGPISFFSLCEHHALPFHGLAYVGYIPHERIIGISKLTRLVRMFARRFTVQERVGQEVADHLEELMQPHGVAVHLRATHLCTQMRGVREENVGTWTSFWRGNYEHEPSLREEFLRAASNGSPSA
jgi:GTP cyclohydrolase IA